VLSRCAVLAIAKYAQPPADLEEVAPLAAVA